LLNESIVTSIYLSVSDDGELGLTANGEAFDDTLEVTIISLKNKFFPIDLGRIDIQNVNFPDKNTIYLSSKNGVTKFDLSFLNEHIFASGFDFH